MTAEARFIRALCHLDLVRLFAHPYGYTVDNSHPGIIIKTTTNPDPKPRNTVGEVYDFMISELIEIFTFCQKTMEVMPVIMLQEHYWQKFIFK